jgi:aconitate hydratase
MKFTTILELSNYDKRVLKEGGAVNYLKNKLK